ncbi:MAG: PepSY-like domain-containing protein [Prevotella sp.]|jgi:hypothetical protein|nr:PepSY-like domain-containing protein [Prevotella sp.]MBR6138227.1 PepSY-like domain-containing protein [Prevotella sp.]
MKRMRLLFIALLSMMVTSVAFADDKPIPVEKLPAAARTFVDTNFPGKKILYAEKDWNSYECRLDDGTKIDFTSKGEWKQVDCHGMSAVPAVLVPEAIKQYVETNFSNCMITKIDKERHGYDIELSNDLELRFNHQGALIGMDD